MIRVVFFLKIGWQDELDGRLLIFWMWSSEFSMNKSALFLTTNYTFKNKTSSRKKQT